MTTQVDASVSLQYEVYHLTNRAFVLAQRPDVSFLSPSMPGPQQTMWVSLSSATLQASQYDTSEELQGHILQGLEGDRKCNVKSISGNSGN